MPDRRLRNRVARRLAVFGPAGIVVLAGLLSYGALRRLTGTRRMVQHTHDVLDASSRTLVALLDAETSARGYIITKDTTFLDPGHDAPERAARALDDLRSLSLANPAQGARVDTLRARVTARLRMLDSVVDLQRRGRFDASARAVRFAAGPAVMADARRLIAVIASTEESLLGARRDAERQSIDLAALVTVGGALLAALLAFLVNRNFDRALRERRLALAEAEQANAQLQRNAIELELQAEAAQNAATEAEQASDHAHEALLAAEASERRAERLQSATEALTGALSIEDVATLIVEEAVSALGASSGALATMVDDGATLQFLAVRGISDSGPGERFPVSAELPVCNAAREGRAVILPSLDQIARQFPAVVERHRRDGVQAVAAFPLVVEGRVTGVLLIRFNKPHSLDPANVAFMVAMARIAAEAFERARLFDAERTAREAAEAANRAKAAFLASMSHELRTPLQAALGFAQLVRSGVYGAVNEQQAEVLGRVERSQTHLAMLIDDILDFARLEAGRVRIEATPVRLADVIADVAPLVEPQAARKKIELSLLPPDDTLVVMADRHRLRQVLVNLVGNAIKFTPENGTIRVGAVKDGRTATVFISDTGRGIPADRLQSIFDPFVQVEDAFTRTASGAGLGLSISRDLARAMGGDLTVESELGKGSTFSVVLPLAPA